MTDLFFELLASNASAQYNANASLQMRHKCQTLRHNKQSSLHCAMHAMLCAKHDGNQWPTLHLTMHVLIHQLFAECTQAEQRRTLDMQYQLKHKPALHIVRPSVYTGSTSYASVFHAMVATAGAQIHPQQARLMHVQGIAYSDNHTNIVMANNALVNLAPKNQQMQCCTNNEQQCVLRESLYIQV